MSKQKDAKTRQGYVEKHTQRECGTCEHYCSDIIQTKTDHTWRGIYIHVQEKNRRCKIGGFAVKKTALCHEYHVAHKLKLKSGDGQPVPLAVANEMTDANGWHDIDAAQMAKTGQAEKIEWPDESDYDPTQVMGGVHNPAKVTTDGVEP